MGIFDRRCDHVSDCDHPWLGNLGRSLALVAQEERLENQMQALSGYLPAQQARYHVGFKVFRYPGVKGIRSIWPVFFEECTDMVED